MPYALQCGIEHPPVTLNGKIDKESLRNIILQDSENEETIETLWTKYTKEEPNEFDNFIESGGDSFSAVVISEAFNDNDLIDILLNKTFQDVKSDIESKNLTLKHQLKIPRFSENQEAKNSEAAIFKIKWKQNLDKCIDASPLIIGDKIVIGSHSGLIAAFDLDVGKEAWKVQLDDRIEASSNSNDSSIFVGTYSGSFYSLDFLTGKIQWKNQDSCDIIKSQALVSTDLVIFGSH